jgi:hypothetical protein
MKFVLCVGILAAVSAVTVPRTTAQSTPSQEGTIVSVQRRNEASPPVRAGADVGHAPLQSQYYRYDVSVQLNCEVYNLRYESEFDDLPSELSANHRVPVRLKKNAMYLDFPGDMVKIESFTTKLAKQHVSKARRPSNRNSEAKTGFFAEQARILVMSR